MLNKGTHSVFSNKKVQRAVLIVLIWEQRLCWTTGALDAKLMAQQLWFLALLLGLVGTSVVLWLWGLNFFYSEKKLSHLVLDDTSDLGIVLDIRPGDSHLLLLE